MWEFNQIKDLYLRIIVPRNVFIEFITRCEGRPDSPLRERGKSLQFVKDLKGAKLKESRWSRGIKCCIQP